MKVRTLLEITNQVPAKKTAVQEKFKVQINVVLLKLCLTHRPRNSESYLKIKFAVRRKSLNKKKLWKNI